MVFAPKSYFLSCGIGFAADDCAAPFSDVPHTVQHFHERLAAV
jgi:hypothetical protein